MGDTPRDRLIRLAAAMLMSSSAPSVFIGDHQRCPARVPVRWWQEICAKLYAVKDEQRRWAIEAREIADQIRREAGEVTNA